jgi:bifunctional UDP-N-acetylglucosamine pyrophosphorylase/glucosamine-1-phosphate N-acetyltransferase
VNTENIFAVILAAGKGKRMNSSLPKVAHLLLNKPLIIWVLESITKLGINKIVPVISPEQNLVKELIEKSNITPKPEVFISFQTEQKGTAHAVQCGINEIERLFINIWQKSIPIDLKVLVAYGDTPCVKSSTFENLIIKHQIEKNDFTVLAFQSKNPFGYGRVVVDSNNEFDCIREQKDCSSDEEKISLCNSGILCANFRQLSTILPLIENHNSANEFYLTDVPYVGKKMGLKIGLSIEPDENQFLGINTQEQLKQIEDIVRK